jgi:hypothetical protein
MVVVNRLYEEVGVFDFGEAGPLNCIGLRRSLGVCGADIVLLRNPRIKIMFRPSVQFRSTTTSSQIYPPFVLY